MRNIYIFLILFLASCENKQTYTCVCYIKPDMENYKKYPIKNTYGESEYYCELMSNAQQSCHLSE